MKLSKMSKPKLYDNPKNILQQRINEQLDCDDQSIIAELIRLSLDKKAETDSKSLKVVEIYNLLGIEKFTELITLMNGSTVEFPTAEEFKDTVILVLCYYYKDILHKDWDEIKSLLAEPDLNTVKYGIHMATFKGFLNKMMGRMISHDKQRSKGSSTTQENA